MLSVCIATYNGSHYIKAQLDSILDQLDPEDEIVLCDDCSIDNTVALVSDYEDPRIRIFVNDRNIGHVRTFEKAIRLASGALIALSDQDDIWIAGRLELMKKVFRENGKVVLVASNYGLINADSDRVGHFDGLKEHPKTRLGRIVGIFLGKLPILGCTILMTKTIAERSLPFPLGVEAHDIWIPLVANTFGKTHHLLQSTLDHRIHANNLTPTKKRSLGIILRSRYRLLMSYLGLLFANIRRKP